MSFLVLVCRTLEEAAKKDDEQFLKDFTKNRMPVLKGQIANLEKVCSSLQERMENEMSKGY